MFDWLSHIPGWAWIIVVFVTLNAVRIEVQLRTITLLLTELRDHFIAANDNDAGV